jgi:hypothetical protein
MHSALYGVDKKKRKPEKTLDKSSGDRHLYAEKKPVRTVYLRRGQTLSPRLETLGERRRIILKETCFEAKKAFRMAEKT